MENTRLFLKEAGFIAKQQQDAILKLSLLTGLAEQINPILKHIRMSKGEKFEGNFLEELRGKTIPETSEYVGTHGLEEIFRFVGEDGEDITQEEFNEVLVAQTQINWFGRSGERWKGVDISERLESFDNFEEIRMEVAHSGVLQTDQSQPEAGNPVAILGATISTMENRLRYSIELGLENEKIYFLVGNRSLNELETQIPELLGTVQQICLVKGLPQPNDIKELTETHGAMFVADKINKERTLKRLQPIDFNFVDTPEYLNFENPTVSRPNTEATIRQFLIDTLDDDGININRVTFISNGANVEAQKIAVERVLAENRFENHTAIVKGENCPADTKFSRISGTMAGRLYSVFLREKYDTASKLESKSKESFRDKILSYTQGNLKSVISQ